MLLEDTEKNTPTGECHIDILSFSSTTDFHEIGVFHRMQWDAGHPYSKHMENKSPDITERQPTNSNKRLAAITGTSQASVHHTQQEQFHPNHIHSVQELAPHDAPARHKLLSTYSATVGWRPYVYS
jgi:hypothetical protein